PRLIESINGEVEKSCRLLSQRKFNASQGRQSSVSIMDYILHIIGIVLLLPCQSIQTEKSFWDLFTAGNTKCRNGTECGYYDYAYRWCYINDNNNWEYCCSDVCALHGETYQNCKSGNTWEYCNQPSYGAEKGQRCHKDHPCGLHRYTYQTSLRFWCYIDIEKKIRAYCCPDYTPNCNEIDSDLDY
ncbi:hypothetical protein CHS0354_036581, partial [Potamilus streckersoni]